MSGWRILLVDDEPDVHSITALVLKPKRWRQRRFELTSAYSHAEAVEILDRQQNFHVAIVDMAMEKETSGLELCGDIRATCPLSTRIILRTGQPGLAPTQQALDDLDVDHYVAKSDATPAKLYSLIRACLRGSQVVSTLLAYQDRHDRLVEALNTARTAGSKVEELVESLLEELEVSGVSTAEDLEEVGLLLTRNLDRAQRLIEEIEPPEAQELPPPSKAER